MITRRRTGNLLMLLACVVAASLLAVSRVQAQEVVTTETGGALARKFDEFELVGGCDHSARLDNFAITLQQSPELIGYVIAYGPEGDGSGSGNFRLRISKDYLVTGRGIDPERIRTIYGGRYKNLEETASELWLATPEAEAPQPAKYENKAAEFTGKFRESEVWDGLPYGDYESLGPPMGDVGLANFADTLRLKPEARAYIVVYNDEKSTPGAWRRVATATSDNLQTNYGIQADRIKITFGGYEKKAKLQLWILPADAPPPVEEVKHEPTLTKAIHFGSFSTSQLTDKENEQWVFKGVANELRNNKELRACIIIRSEFLGVKEVEEAEVAEEAAANEEAAVAELSVEASEEQEGAADEVPDVEPLQLVEKWKKDLLKQYGIGEERLVVIVAPARDEYTVGEMEAWIVPKDAALPDPSAPVEEEEEEETVADEEETPKSQP